MTAISRTRLASAAIALLMLAVVATGCAAPKPVEAPSDPSQAAAVIAIPRMTAEGKRSTIATSFPIEVPVPQGRVTRGQAQGTDAWDYQLSIDASAQDVAAWYADAYTKADWQLVDNQAVGDTIRLTLVKNGAQSQVTVKSVGQDQSTTTVILGVGVPVLDTQ